MSPYAVGISAALISALTQASAHSMLKSGRDKLAVRGLIGGTETAVMLLPSLLLVPLPTLALAPWLLASNVVHAVYQLVLIKAYEEEDFAVAYPIARGVAPLCTALLGCSLLGDQLTWWTWAGVGVISGGLLTLGWSGRSRPSGLVAAAAAGLLVTLYTVIDAKAVRLAPDPWTFISWFFVLDGVFMVSILLFVRRGRTLTSLRQEGRRGVVAGLTSLVTYMAALIALDSLSTGAASALRETSVVFAAAIARYVLDEQVTRRRALASAAVAVGAALLVWSLKS